MLLVCVCLYTGAKGMSEGAFVVRDKREIKHRRKDVGAAVTARTQLVRWSGRRSEWCHTLPEAVRRPIRQRVRDPPQVGSPCSPLRTLSRLHAGGVDLGCDPASWFSVAGASMGKDGRPDLHSVPTHARRKTPNECMRDLRFVGTP